MLLNKKGFTLIEVLVVVLIIGILAALAAPNILGRIEQSRITSDKAMAKTLENAVASYLVDQDAANQPSTPPPAGTSKTEAGAFVDVIVNETYLDQSTVDWITTQTEVGFQTVGDNDEVIINGKSKSIVIVYSFNDTTNNFTVAAYDTSDASSGYSRVTP